MKNKLREIWAEYGLAVKIIAVGAAFMIVLTGVALYEHEVDAARKLAEKQKIEKAERRAAAKRKKTRQAEVESAPAKSGLSEALQGATVAYFEARAQAEERAFERKYIDPGEFVRTYRREPAFTDKVDAYGYNDSVQQGEYELADFVFNDRSEKGEACRLRNGDEYEVVAVHGSTIQVFDPATGKAWWISEKYVREVDDN